jgi:hypothetical protein
MASNAIEHNIRQLPLYRLGWNDGHDLGLGQALDAITFQRARLRPQTDSPCHDHVDGRLGAVAKVIGISSGQVCRERQDVGRHRLGWAGLVFAVLTLWIAASYRFADSADTQHRKEHDSNHRSGVAT